MAGAVLLWQEHDRVELASQVVLVCRSFEAEFVLETAETTNEDHLGLPFKVFEHGLLIRNFILSVMNYFGLFCYG